MLESAGAIVSDAALMLVAVLVAVLDGRAGAPVDASDPALSADIASALAAASSAAGTVSVSRLQAASASRDAAAARVMILCKKVSQSRLMLRPQRLRLGSVADRE